MVTAAWPRHGLFGSACTAAEEIPDENGKPGCTWRPVLPPGNQTTTLDHTTKETHLSDVLDMLTGVFSGKVAVEKGRFGLQRGWTTASAHPRRPSWNISDPIHNERHPRLPHRIASKGTIKSSRTPSTIFDLALRYRAGEIRAKDDGVGEIGFAGMRLIDASLDMDVSFKDESPSKESFPQGTPTRR